MDWQIEDIIDLEWQFHRDLDRDPDELRRRDRSIAHDRQLDKRSTRMKILVWLRVVRRKEEGPWPGEVFAKWRRVCSVLMVVIGLLAGFGLMGLVCQYDGKTPVNVATFLWATLGWQIVLTGLALLTVLFLHKSRWHDELAVFSGLISRLLNNQRMQSWFGKIPEGRKAAAYAGLGKLREEREIYGDLAWWPGVILLQTLAVAFNVGLLAAFIGIVLTKDLAFAWESTAIENPQRMADVVRSIASPWAWLHPSACPSLEIITETHYEKRQGLGEISTESLQSWWVFLAYSIGFWGLGLRAAVLLLATRLKKRALKKIRFSHNNCHELLRRFKPHVEVKARQEPVGPGGDEIPDIVLKQDESGQQVSHSDLSSPIVVWFGIDADDKTIKETLKNNCELNVGEIMRVGSSDLTDDRVIIDRLEKQSWAKDGQLVILFDACEAPGMGEKAFLAEVRKTIGKQINVVVLLVGDPSAGVATPVDPMSWKVWTATIQALGDPWLRVERIVA